MQPVAWILPCKGQNSLINGGIFFVREQSRAVIAVTTGEVISGGKENVVQAPWDQGDGFRK